VIELISGNLEKLKLIVVFKLKGNSIYSNAGIHF